ncbi:man(5)GlcNAc(2)-PP-dolichol translocation protein RFT1 isoform X1 [Bactrocera oleae]|uniref:man(5)GlcNAc(2)-PP-dolichol translocation protein RFT1 isoform X1 n=2 Tax=Bactrocera oleae TaxID=104688 RepID=UPI00387E5CD7
MERNVLHSSILSGAFSIIFQVLCRILTFAINAFIVRNVGRDVLGIMNVRLLLLESTLLFLSREAFNRAGLSATTQQRNKCSWAQLINQMWLTSPTCIVICIPCVYTWLHLLTPVEEKYNAQYQFGCYAMALSCIVELCAEAPSFVTQVFCFVRVRIVLNTLHILVRSAVFLWIVINDKSVAINAFAIAQLMSTATIIIGNYGFFYFYIRRLNQNKKQNDMKDFPFTKLSEFFPGVMKNEDKFFNSELQILTLSFVKQGVLKQILTEGEKYVMSVSPVLNFSEQATYDVVNNLGSLAARFIFRPIEESSYFFFTQTIARDVDLYKQKRESVVQTEKVLHNLSLAVTSIGLLALTFGQSYSHTLLLLYGGVDFVAGGLPEKLLRWHCLAIYFLAINGITEGYMFATNTSRDIDKYNYLMAIFSVSFLILSYILTSFLGPVGFIFANCINMFCRICYSTHFIYRQYQPTGLMPLKGLLPGKWFIITLLITGLFCKYVSSSSILVHLLYGFLSVSCCLLVWFMENSDLVKLGWRYGQRIKND